MEHQKKSPARRVIIRYESANSSAKQRRRPVTPPPPDPTPVHVDVHQFTELVQSLTGRKRPRQNAPQEQTPPALENPVQDIRPEELQVEHNPHPPEEQSSEFLPTPANFVREIRTHVELGADNALEFDPGNAETFSESKETASPFELETFLDSLPSPLPLPHFLLADDLPPLGFPELLSPSSIACTEMANEYSALISSQPGRSTSAASSQFSCTSPIAFKKARAKLMGGTSSSLEEGDQGKGNGNGGSSSRCFNRSPSSWELCVDEVMNGDCICIFRE